MRVRLLLLSLVAAFLLTLHTTGVYGSIEPQRFRAWLQDAGPWGGLLFISVYGALQPLGVRSIFFLLCAPLVWEPTYAFLLSWVGTMAASLAAFGFARFVARAWVQRRLPRGVRRLDDRLVARGFRTVTLLRLVFYTAPTLQFALGVSRVRFKQFVLGTAIGIIPFTALITLLGAQINDWLAAHPVSSWPWDRFGAVIVGAALLTIGFISLAVRKWQTNLSFGDSARADLATERQPS
jgi:uncharacterized membrane protein YdjX (TVP38/TMEM64 family)